jgi:LemA protein
MPLLIVGIIFLIILISYISMYNTFKKIENKIQESYSSIDVYLSKRYNAVMNCLNVCKGYAKHEKDVLESVIELRNGSIKEIANTNNEIDKVNKNIIALSESYPDLKADKVYIELQNVIFDCERHLAAARRFYNSNVALLNQKVDSFPNNLVASMHKIEKKEYYKALAEERNNVIV